MNKVYVVTIGRESRCNVKGCPSHVTVRAHSSKEAIRRTRGVGLSVAGATRYKNRVYS